MAEKRYTRITVDTDAYPELVFIELGMSPNNLLGYFTVLSVLPGIRRSTKAEGLLAHNLGVIMKGLRPHFIIRQYWRSFADLERYARGDGTHKSWWREMVQDTRHTTIWHETYSIKGGVDAIYGTTGKNYGAVGLAAFAPRIDARGSAYSARKRMHAEGDETTDAPVSEDEHIAYDLTMQDNPNGF